MRDMYATERLEKFQDHSVYLMDRELLQRNLDDGHITSEILLSGTKLYSESSRDSILYKDNRYLPFYYHLGKQLQPKEVVQIGPVLGLVGACFLRSCQTVEHWLAIGNGEKHCGAIIKDNLVLHTKYQGTWGHINYMGLIPEMLEPQIESDIKYDLGFLTESFDEGRYRKYLDFLWTHLASEGLLVADYISSNSVFHDFCRVKNREPMIFDTRYGVGIVQR